MKFRLALLTGFALLCASGNAHATVLFDTVTGISPLYADGPQTDGVTLMGDSFAAPTNDTVSIGLWLSASNPSDGGSTQVYLVADSGTGGATGIAGYPTITNASGDFIGFTGSNSQLVATIGDSSLSSSASLTSVTVTPAISTLNDEYWVVVQSTSNSSFEWYYEADGSGIGTANQAFVISASYGPATPAPDSQGPYMMKVSTVALPEPGTLTLFGGALAGLACVRRRRAGRRA